MTAPSLYDCEYYMDGMSPLERVTFQSNFEQTVPFLQNTDAKPSNSWFQYVDARVHASVVVMKFLKYAQKSRLNEDEGKCAHYDELFVSFVSKGSESYSRLVTDCRKRVVLNAITAYESEKWDIFDPRAVEKFMLFFFYVTKGYDKSIADIEKSNERDLKSGTNNINRHQRYKDAADSTRSLCETYISIYLNDFEQ